MLDRAVELVREAIGGARATLFLVDRGRRELVQRAGKLPELPELRVPIERGVVGHVAQTGRAVRLSDPSADPRFWPDVDRRTGFSTASLLAQPVHDRDGAVIGVMEVLNKDGGFSESDEEALAVLCAQLAQVLERTSLAGQLGAPASISRAYRYNGILGSSEAMQRVQQRVAKAAATDATVLLRGETGTGKGLIARAIHVNGARRSRPFVAIDCAALPPALVESTLFGHERGAFTGAHARAIGRFEAANGGTVFLDEIAELPIALQSRLLTVLQERTLQRVGGRKAIEVDVRIVAATHRDLEQMVARQQFREDLYYRIRVVPIRVPALRERDEADIDLLAHHFARLYGQRHRGHAMSIADAALQRLRAHRWPGNVRELENCIESAAVLADGDAIEPADLPLPATTATRDDGESLASLTWAQMQRRYIEAVLAAHDGNKSAAARAMGIGRSTLLRKLAELG